MPMDSPSPRSDDSIPPKAGTDLRLSFPGHYRLSEKQLEAMWKDAIIVFDANVLLNAYRYSAEAWRDLMRALEPVQKQLWLPFQIAHEFHENRILVIESQTRSYSDARGRLQQLQTILSAPRSHPFINASLLSDAMELFTTLHADLTSKEQELEALLTSADSRLDQIVRLFQDVQQRPPDDELQELHRRARDRLDRNIPPGTADSKKSEGRHVGDAIIWLQMLNRAKDGRSPLIFVTDDVKDDWWLRVRGRTIGPLPELITEFLQTTGQRFHAYTAAEFTEHSLSRQGTTMPRDTLSELLANITEHPSRAEPILIDDDGEEDIVLVRGDNAPPHLINAPLIAFLKNPNIEELGRIRWSDQMRGWILNAYSAGSSTGIAHARQEMRVLADYLSENDKSLRLLSARHSNPDYDLVRWSLQLRGPSGGSYHSRTIEGPVDD